MDRPQSRSSRPVSRATVKSAGTASTMTAPCGTGDDSKNLGVARKQKKNEYPSEQALQRYRRRIRVELVRDVKDKYGRNFWGKQEERKRIFSCSGNHTLHVRAVVRLRPLLFEEEEGNGGEGQIPHFEENGLTIMMPNTKNGLQAKHSVFNTQCVYFSDIDQAAFFEAFMPPFLRSFLSGGISAVIFYGAENSGKLYSLFGPTFWNDWKDERNRLIMEEEEAFRRWEEEATYRPQSRETKSARPQSRGIGIDSRPQSARSTITRPMSRASSAFTNFPGDQTAMLSLGAMQRVPEGNETDGVFPRSVRHIFREIERRLVQEQTVISVSLSVIVVQENDPFAYDMLGLNPSEKKSIRWNAELEMFWPEKLLELECTSYEHFVGACFDAKTTCEALKMSHATIIYMSQSNIMGLSDRWDVRGDRLPEGLERKGRLFFVHCADANQESVAAEQKNMKALIECLAKARSNAFPTGKEKLVLPIARSPLTQILSAPLRPGQMIQFVACGTDSMANYESSFQTFKTCDFIHTANRRSDIDENTVAKRHNAAVPLKSEVGGKNRKNGRRKTPGKLKNEGKDQIPATMTSKNASERLVDERVPVSPTTKKPSRLTEMLSTPSLLIQEALKTSKMKAKNLDGGNKNCQMFFGPSDSLIHFTPRSHQRTTQQSNLGSK